MHFVYFLGRFHVVLIHLPIGFLLATLFVESLTRREKYKRLDGIAPFLWGVASLSAIATAVLGYMHYAEGGFTGWPIWYHRLFGTLLAIGITIVWLIRARYEDAYRKIQTPVALLLLVLVIAAGHTGGSVTHGPSFLVELAPLSLRSLAGVRPPKAAPRDWASADPYDDIVQPIFKARCSACHGEDTQKNSLSLVTYAAAMKGGKDGMDIVPGDLEHSDLFRRITLPQDNKDFMPAEGKPPMTSKEIQLVKWWIQAGAPAGTPVGRLSTSPEIKALLVERFGKGALAPVAAERASAANPATAGSVPLQAHPADPKLIDAIAGAGFAVRQVSQENPHLVVSANGGGKPVSPESLQALLQARDQIDEVDLQRSGLEDTALTTIAQMPNIQILRLDGNKITDQGLHQLLALKNLRVLNLYGNQEVTDAGLQTVARLPSLGRVYVWNTKVTERAARALRKKRPGLIVDVGSELTSETQSADSSSQSPPTATGR